MQVRGFGKRRGGKAQACLFSAVLYMTLKTYTANTSRAGGTVRWKSNLLDRLFSFVLSLGLLLLLFGHFLVVFCLVRQFVLGDTAAATWDSWQTTKQKQIQLNALKGYA